MAQFLLGPDFVAQFLLGPDCVAQFLLGPDFVAQFLLGPDCVAQFLLIGPEQAHVQNWPAFDHPLLQRSLQDFCKLHIPLTFASTVLASVVSGQQIPLCHA